MNKINNVLIVGAGNMGEAMLKGWLKANNMLKQVYVREPDPSNWLKKVHNEKKILLNPSNIIGKIDVGIFAVKPQVAEKVILDTKSDLSKESFIILWYLSMISFGVLFSDFALIEIATPCSSLPHI